jgi:predicted dehydrogenase
MTAARVGAIVGFGNVAVHGHLPGWRARPEVRIDAVVDADAQRRALVPDLLPEARTHATLDDLLRKQRLDFVDIATPPALHADDIVKAATAGVHVLCEKPLTVSQSQYDAARDAAQRSGVVLHAVHNWKHSEAFRTATGIVHEGRLGRLQKVVFETRRDGFSVSRDDWRLQPALAGGGILFDHGWHNLYLLLSLTEERPTHVRAALEKRRYVDAEVEDTARCDLEFPSLQAEIRLTWAASERLTRWEIVGTEGKLTIEEDRVHIEGQRPRSSRQLQTGLSAGSHHPEWFPPVIESFFGEIDEPRRRGRSQLEAEWCLHLLTLAYASGARGGHRLRVSPLRDTAGAG